MRDRSARSTRSKQPVAIDLFCGAGGLTRGLANAGVVVAAGYDIDPACRFPYSRNNPSTAFRLQDVGGLSGAELNQLYPKGSTKILVGCAPCTPFSKYNFGSDPRSHSKWGLLQEFGRLIRETKPEIVSMENVPQLQRDTLLRDFLQTLREEGFHFSDDPKSRVAYCPAYGLPQQRSRLVIIASRLGPINLLPPTHTPDEYVKVCDVIGGLPALAAGAGCPDDPLHRASSLSPMNLKRIQHSKPGGNWRDWPTVLRVKCHKRRSGKTYPSVYGRMEWNKPAPTITTQFYGYGNGRFGHPEQDRAISLREGAILQSFPKTYEFVKHGESFSFKTIGRLIGNAVPVRLGEVIGMSIVQHIAEHQ